MFGVFGGAKYYFGRKAPARRWFPYAGAILVVVPEIFGTGQSVAAYMPIGVQYVFPWGLELGGEAAVMVGAEGVLPYGALRTAFRF